MFSSISFLIILALIWLIYIVLPGNCRKAVLLVASYVLCGYLSLKALVALLVSSLVAFAGARLIEKYEQDRKKAKTIALITAVVFAFVLIVVKNIPYAIDVLGINALEGSVLTSLVLPIGFSFYAFSAIGYIYDVYQKKEKAETDFVTFALFMSFFPKLVSGPIERKGRFTEQLNKIEDIVVWNTERLSLAVTYMLWGYFLKMVVADRLAIIVNELHGAPEAYDMVWLVMGAVFYSFQIYADFAGYSCIAIGCAMLFGIELIQNFNCPYFSKNITEFWRRWHMSLSSWLRDYIYIPLGGNRKGSLRKQINTLIVFILCGIWHGNGLSFLVWGLLHGIFSMIDSTLGKKVRPANVFTTAISRVVTFALVTFAWIFFRADTFASAVTYIKEMFTNGINPMGPVAFFTGNGISLIQVLLSVALIILVQVIDKICVSKECIFAELLQKNRIVKYAFFYICIMAIFIFGMYGGDFNAENFIYMQF